MERFHVTYRVFAVSQNDAEARAASIALENTVEIPRDLVPKGYIEDVVLGEVEDVCAEAEDTWQARIGYHVDAVGREFPQFLNVLLGNASIFKGVKAISLDCSPALNNRFPGARIGAEGVRVLAGKQNGGFACPVIKPQGSSISDLAKLCYDVARAGADIVKEDHGLANQDAAPFRARVKGCAAAVARANSERRDAGDKSQTLYFANIGGHGDQVRDLAMFAKDAGAHGILLMPGLFGFDAINRLAQDPGFELPIMSHPSHLGPYVLSPDTGYGHGLLFGTLMRLAGADISVFPNYGGRFGFSKSECLEIAQSCANSDGPGKAILPSPGGGMSVERLAEMRATYGENCVYLLGGSLLRHRAEIGNAITQMRRLLDT